MEKNILERITEQLEDFRYRNLSVENALEQLNITPDEVYEALGDRENIKKHLIPYAEKAYLNYQRKYIEEHGDVYLSYGMSYVLFARDHKTLFELIFMREREMEEQNNDGGTLFSVPVSIVMDKLKIGYYEANQINIDMWVYTHGLATIIANNYISLDEKIIEDLIRNAFYAMTTKYNLFKGKDY